MYTKSQQIDYKHLLFAHFIIADITFKLKNCTFAEIVPHTFYPLYGTSQSSQLALSASALLRMVDMAGRVMQATITIGLHRFCLQIVWKTMRLALK